MSWKRRWGIVTVLALLQAGIIIWYQGFFAGSAAPAMAPSGDTTVVAPRPGPLAQPAPVPTRDALPPTSPRSVTVARADLPNLPPTTAEPPMFPQDLGTVPPITGPPAPPVTALPDSGAIKKASATSGDEKVIPGLPAPPSVVPMKGLSDLMPISAQSPTPAPPAPKAVPDPAGPSPMGPPASGSPMLPAPTPQEPHAPLTGGVAPGSVPPPALSDPLMAPTSPTPPSPAVQPKKSEPAPLEGPCPWTLRVEIINGRTLLTAQTGKEVQFRVNCDKLDLQAPRGNIQASGNVRVASDGLNGACEKLTIAWHKDQVVLEGAANLKCQRDGQEVDLKAAKLTLRLTVSVRSDTAKATGRPGEVRGTTFLSRSKSARGEARPLRPRPVGAPASRQVVQPAGGSDDGTYDRYPGNEPPRRGSKIDD